MAMISVDDLRSRVVAGVAEALGRPAVRWMIPADGRAAMAALSDVVSRPDPAVLPFLTLWLGAVPAHYANVKETGVADLATDKKAAAAAAGRALGDIGIPQDVVDQWDKIKETVKADGKELALEAKDLARFCVQHSVEAARAFLGLLLSKLPGGK